MDDGAALVNAVATAWVGRPRPAVRMLPDVVRYGPSSIPPRTDARCPSATAWRCHSASPRSDLRPVLADFAAEPHLMAFGDSECGKSSLLRGLAESILRRFTPEEARIVLVDYRRSLLGAVETEHLIGYGTTAAETGALMESVAGYMERRRPGAEVTAQQLRERSWWTGPECFVLVDDYDLVATGPTNPLLPLLEHLAQARDLGLHLVVARRAGGASRRDFRAHPAAAAGARLRPCSSWPVTGTRERSRATYGQAHCHPAAPGSLPEDREHAWSSSHTCPSRPRPRSGPKSGQPLGACACADRVRPGLAGVGDRPRLVVG